MQVGKHTTIPDPRRGDGVWGGEMSLVMVQSGRAEKPPALRVQEDGADASECCCLLTFVNTKINWPSEEVEAQRCSCWFVRQNWTEIR